MQAMVRPLRIAIVNDGDDTISALYEWFQSNGHAPLVLKATDLRRKMSPPSAAIASLKPDALVFDVGIPYAVNWYYGEMIRLALPQLPVLITTANQHALQEIVGPNTAFELTATPKNLVALLALVYEACGRSAEGQILPSALPS